MFAVIETGGKQYVVEEGTIIDVEALPGDAQSNIEFSDVLMVFEDGKTPTQIGTPTVSNAKVKGTILGQNKDKKIRVFKFKPKTGFQKTIGHRQNLTSVRIDKISVSASKAKATKADAKDEKKEEAKES